MVLQGINDLNTVYDSQKEIMLQSLKGLEQPNQELSKLIKNPRSTGSAKEGKLFNDLFLNNDLKR